MLNYKRERKGRMGFSIPFFDKAKESAFTKQGKYIVYVIVICSLIGGIIQWPIGSALKQHEISLKGRELNQIEAQTIEERATLIAMSVTIFLLIVSILNMSRFIKQRRTQNLKEKGKNNYGKPTDNR
ncbi:hypothetical protein FJZ31_13545 [Candidatus Poribacteria bacterium]|nr:hypothetical protein [Candidatus Poribacteria bacterium]